MLKSNFQKVQEQSLNYDKAMKKLQAKSKTASDDIDTRAKLLVAEGVAQDYAGALEIIRLKEPDIWRAYLMPMGVINSDPDVKKYAF